MKNSKQAMEDALAELLKRRGKGNISRAQVDDVVSFFMKLPLDEAERQLKITDTNDVRQRASYSKNRYYLRPSPKALERRRELAQKVLERTD